MFKWFISKRELINQIDKNITLIAKHTAQLEVLYKRINILENKDVAELLKALENK